MLLLFATAEAITAVFEMVNEREYKGSEGATDMLLLSTFITINWQSTIDEQMHSRRESDKARKQEIKKARKEERKHVRKK